METKIFRRYFHSERINFNDSHIDLKFTSAKYNGYSIYKNQI